MLLGNAQMYKGYIASEIVKDKYDILCRIAGIGIDKNLKEFKHYHKAVYLVSEDHLDFSMDNALDEEIALAKQGLFVWSKWYKYTV